jgi:hypothetical protein
MTATQVQQVTDSIAQTISDFNTAFVSNTAANAPTANTILAGFTGTGASNTLGRILGLGDLNAELSMLSPANKAAGNITSYIGSLRSISAFYQQLFPLLDALDSATGGLNAFLTSNAIQVNGWFAKAFTAYQALAVALGYRSSAPTALSAANYFPYTSVDNMWAFTAATATTFSSNAVSSNPTTAVSGGGVGPLVIYKSNASNAIGGATFTITYITAAGTSTNATYSTVSGTPAASGTLATGYTVSGAIGSAITAVTGTGMTAGESYILGIKTVRTPSY